MYLSLCVPMCLILLLLWDLNIPKNKFEPWMINNTHYLRRACRGAECRWKKYNLLQVSYEILQESLISYQKAAKSCYFSEIIAKNSNNPRTLFNILNSVFNPVGNNYLTESSSLCENFWVFSVDKMIRKWLDSLYYPHLLIQQILLWPPGF